MPSGDRATSNVLGWLPRFQSLQQVAFRPPTRFFPLPPVGVGTAYVEGLSSYIARLAEAHSNVVGDFITFELLSGAASCSLQTPLNHYFRKWNEINGIGSIPRAIVVRLEDGTGTKGIESLTILRIEDCISTVDLLHTKRQWCPICLDSRRDDVIYEPLIWSLTPVTACPLHNIQLEQACHNCGRRSAILRILTRIGRCSHCGTWLGRSNYSAPSATSQETARAIEVGKLLEFTSTLSHIIAKQLFLNNLRRCIEVVTNGNVAEFVRICGVGINSINTRGKRLPKLGALVEIALRLRVPTKAFFEEDIANNEKYWESAAARVRPHLRPDLNRSTDDLRELLRAASMEIPAPSLREITVRLGYKSTERLYQADTPLCKQISENYAKSGRSHFWKTPDAIPICHQVDLKQLLETSLTQEHPESCIKLAERLGYTNEGYLRMKYPELCDAIAKKIAALELARKTEQRKALSDALDEYPVPSLEALKTRLGYATSTSLRYNFPELCDAIDSKHAQERADFLAAKSRAIRALLKRTKLTWKEVEREIGNRIYVQTNFPELYLQLKTKCADCRRAERVIGLERLRKDVIRAVQLLSPMGRTPTLNTVKEMLPPGKYRSQKPVAKALRAVLSQQRS